ncbi:probable cytochrome P450 6a14 [Macrosteles quadrilineatus]|uniref:probable cytochrome P450 6a14 n=1 Tax=Macrosteles quadrilineatus TaxID=74068 RepID=UPI0023E20FD3|nr:probable cytochrome P450 6a14 [Macrosteles quadrilineatus]
MIVEVVLSLSLIFIALYYYLTKKYDYWEKKGVEYIKPVFPFGTMWDQMKGKTDAGTLLTKNYTENKKKGLKYVGLHTLRQPTLLILDLDLVKHILTKDFHNFVARNFTPTTHEYISKHLFSLEGQEWKDMRTKLTPTFTSGKMKNMFILMEKCTQQLQDHIENVILKKGEFEVKDLIARLTTDIIATCAFGLEVNSIHDHDNDFFKVGQKIFLPNRMNLFKFLMHSNFPRISRLLKIDFFDPQISVLLMTVMKDTIEYRKKNNIIRNDFVDLLIRVKENKSLEDHDEESKNEMKDASKFLNILKNSLQDIKHQEKDHLTLEEMTAQAFVFFAAGFETAASTTSFCLYELAKAPEVQEKLRREIDEVLANHDGKITYQSIQDMHYMDMVMNETLRLYASLPFLTRVCTERYQLPGTDLVIDEGVRITIPSYCFHHDPDIFPDPYKFDPERFTDENCHSRHHYAFLPFGEGPRICIGMRFGKLQVKVALASILSLYELSPTPDTPDKLEIHPHIVFTTPRHPFSLRITKRTDL